MTQSVQTCLTIPPVYLPDTKRTIGVLQQLQVLLAHVGGEVTLEDVVLQVAALQAEFGPGAVLEDVIQTLVVRQLAGQLVQRQMRSALPEVAA